MQKSFADALQEANQELKREGTSVSLHVRGNVLYARGTFPPRPGSLKVTPHQQSIALRVDVHQTDLDWAKDEARALGVLLQSQAFDWQRYVALERIKVEAKTVSDWIKAFKEAYFTERQRSPKSQSTWRTHYESYLRLLPPAEPLTVELIHQTVQKTIPDSYARKELCLVYTALGRFAGLDVAFLKDLQGTDSSHCPARRHLPSDTVIADVAEKISDPAWRWVFGVLATYGLRPSEAFNLDTRELEGGGITIEVCHGKIGHRVACPLYEEWIELFDLREKKLPNLNFAHNSKYGQRIYNAFRKYEIPFKPSDLRACWAARAFRVGLHPAFAAKWLGYSVPSHIKNLSKLDSEAIE